MQLVEIVFGCDDRNTSRLFDGFADEFALGGNRNRKRQGEKALARSSGRNDQAADRMRKQAGDKVLPWLRSARELDRSTRRIMRRQRRGATLFESLECRLVRLWRVDGA